MGKILSLAKAVQALPHLDGNPDLPDLIESAEAFVRVFTRRDNLILDWAEEIRDGNGFRNLSLREYPIDQVVSLTIGGAELAGYIVYRSTGVIGHPWGCWPSGYQNIAIRYKAGYDPDRPEHRARIANIRRATIGVLQYLAGQTASDATLKRMSTRDYTEERVVYIEQSLPKAIGILLYPEKRLDPLD